MRIAVVGDVHRCWDAEDSTALDRLGYDLVCFVGDLPDAFHRGTLEVARAMARLRTPALLLPGNHDGTTPWGVLAESIGRGLTRPGAGRRGLTRLDRLQQALGPVALAGFSIHPFPDHDTSIVAGRPFAMGPPRASFADLLEARHGLRTLQESRARLEALLASATGRIVVLAHNGPAGLGTDPRAPFADPRGRDLGDPDLRDAVTWAVGQGLPVVAVVAGHVHHDGRSRRWQVHRDGVTWVNAARVPRVDHHTGRTRRHHVALRIGLERVEVREVVV